ncbi:hypothetical protein D1632_04970 [Chryseobacterium nematophagum]|uniref:Signal peptidase n=1 Tax=Chryseobacterium nematophagum TaxID=2305228 RepID=A0A3M7LC16_9FLAO|nr:hypothetical protein [Chryseobacterium nematophagum]RMZ60293.1 hypothetical protein D1632_04970 [Chryseobacterium nematophagum]
MKKVLLVLSMVISASMYSQGDEIPGEPGDPAPIDMYTPALLIIGGGLLLYYTMRKTKKGRVDLK